MSNNSLTLCYVEQEQEQLLIHASPMDNLSIPVVIPRQNFKGVNCSQPLVRIHSYDPQWMLCKMKLNENYSVIELAQEESALERNRSQSAKICNCKICRSCRSETVPFNRWMDWTLFWNPSCEAGIALWQKSNYSLHPLYQNNIIVSDDENSSCAVSLLWPNTKFLITDKLLFAILWNWLCCTQCQFNVCFRKSSPFK